MADKSIGPGSVLADRFRVEDLLAENSGAKFWRATDQVLARSVAVHVIPSDDPRAEELLQAARASATVTDGHFLRVLDAAEEGGVAYVVNEWAAGQSLDLMLVEGPLSPRRAAWLVKEVAEAVTAAHRLGVAHGRLVPENVMVTEAGTVKLIGFAIDAVLNGQPLPSVHSAGHFDGQQSDVTNLAALLYAALVGRWPGADPSALPDAPREHGRPLRPRQVRAGIPRPLDAICDRVLNENPQSQVSPIETAHEICAALADFIGDPAGVVPSGNEPTTVLARSELPTTTVATEVETDAASTRRGEPDAPVDPEQTAAGGPPWLESAPPVIPSAASVREPVADPEATQAGTPVFFGEGAGRADPSEAGAEKGAEEGAEGKGRAPAPPPPPPEPEPRPLFAQGSRGERPRRPEPWEDTSGTGGGSGTGHGTGSLPAVWGPDADEPEPAEGAHVWEPKDAGKSWLRLAATIAAAVLLLFAVLFAFNLGRDTNGSGSTEGGPSSEPSGPAEAAAPVEVAQVSDFDPQGDPPEENPDLVGQAIDGDPDTAWRTMTYYNNPELGGLKDGVGLLLDLGEQVDVSSVKLTLVGSPTDVQLLAAQDGAEAPADVEELEVVATADEAGQEVDLELDESVTTRYLVVWLTSLPPVEGGFRGEIAEIVVRQ